MKKEEKEFLEEEKEEETGCELEKKQFEEKLNGCYGQNKNLTSSGEAYHRQVVNLQRFKELSENCLKDMARLREREVAADQATKSPESEYQDGPDKLVGLQSELKECRESLQERPKEKIEQTEKLNTDLNNCEERLREKTEADSEQIAKINSDLNECKGNLQQHEQAGLRSETQAKECDALKSEVKEVKLKYEACQLKQQKENSTENCQNDSTGKDSEIGGYSYIMQMLYKYGLI